MKYRYLTCCVSSTAELIEAMTDQAREITYDTFRRHVPASVLESVFPHYDWGRVFPGCLRLKDDWHVAYYRSVYDGQICVYAVHSAIEYIFVPRKEHVKAA